MTEKTANVSMDTNEPSAPRVKGSVYDPSLVGMLHDYAESHPYLNVDSNRALATVLGVTHPTISAWMKEHAEFREEVESLRKRQLHLVESALLKRVLGYTFREQNISRVLPDGTVTTTTEKEVLPDSSLLRYYLERRNPERWGEKAGDAGRGHVTVVVEDDPKRFA